MQGEMRKTLDRLLFEEENLIEAHRDTTTGKRLRKSRGRLLAHIRAVAHSGDLALMIETERMIVEGDLERYTNSKQMAASLNTALEEIAAIERQLKIVDDPKQYNAVDQQHSLRKNREKGLPLDEARQALRSHHARLNNLDKSRLDDEEKNILDARRLLVFNAKTLYIKRQANTLGIEPENDTIES